MRTLGLESDTHAPIMANRAKSSTLSRGKRSRSTRKCNSTSGDENSDAEVQAVDVDSPANCPDGAMRLDPPPSTGRRRPQGD